MGLISTFFLIFCVYFFIYTQNPVACTVNKKPKLTNTIIFYVVSSFLCSNNILMNFHFVVYL